MTTTLTHPTAEDLGCFIEGTLDDQARAAIVEHLADCDDCRITVVDAVEFAEPAAFDEKVAVKQSAAGGLWWMTAAASIAIVVGGVWLVQAWRDPLAPLKEASSRLSSRLVDARLSDFPYVVRKSRMRGSSGDTDLAAPQVALKADEVLNRAGTDARMQHAKGVALLLRVEAELPEHTENNADDNGARLELVKQRNEAVAMLQVAADREPDNAAFQSDLAGALMATGDPKNINLAADICSRVVKRNPQSFEALFNQAKALDLAGRTPEAIATYKLYVKVDPASPWSTEANERLKALSEEL
ncbi:MAG TPA: tetratricopeptide repeat protein [Thermoanaerobaculia bacterium]|nr:tetratricopeptide repeat protein [Thermoanaerobaculia bacterium]